ncbi:PilZ domain-containing protein [Clostridium sp. C2-6-12]|uniref:flagellar brake protein n=1 Tax=Clostridium sp. C2-6-12 TaxID=2698832 RepID=UPI0013713271|nr:PilZ domain-containing protein [Clostridium sp. C2-6-12]
MEDFKLRINDRVEVVKDEKAYKALVIDINEDFLTINLPVNDGNYLMLHSNEKIEMTCYLEDGRCFKFYSEVILRGKESNILFYKISPPFDIQKIQRRNFFRVDLTNDIHYKKITLVEEEDYENIPYKKGLMVDLSAGGLKLKAKDNISKDDLLLVKMKVNEVELELKCDIVRIENTEDKEKLCGLRFIEISPAQSELIVRELFKIMRRQRANL